MRTPLSEIRARLAGLRRAMRREKLGGFLATRPTDVRYLSGFTGDDSLLLITPSRQILYTDGRYAEEAAASAPAVEAVLWKRHPMRYAGERVRSMGIRRVGYCARHATVHGLELFRQGARGVAPRPADGLVESLRLRKSDWEIRRIRAALRCAEAALEETRGRVRAGMTEADLRLELEWAMRRRGASDSAFETIVAAGANASRPHAHAGTRAIRAGAPLLIDFGARVAGYNSDLTRVFFLGTVTRYWRERYERVREAQAEALGRIRGGLPAAEADRAARDIFAAAGWERAFTHGLGHGVGLDIHEGPRLGATAAGCLEPGMIVTVEPGLYFPGRGGIRIEDMALVTETGCRRLSRLPRDLDWATLA